MFPFPLPQSSAGCGSSVDFSGMHLMSQPSMHGGTSVTSCFYNSMPQPASPCQYGSPVIHYDMKPVVPSDQIRFNIASPVGSHHGSRIPDIVLTGADELLGQQQSHNGSNSAREVDDLLCLDEALGILDPLALDELQMLTDANVLTDQATEDSFRFD
jgi:hypothetical protein